MSGVAPLCQPQSQSPAMSPFPPAIADATASKSSTSKHPVLRNGHVPTEPVRPQDTNHIHFPPLAYPEPSVSARWKFPERYKGWIGLDGIWIAWTYESWFFSKSWHVCKSHSQNFFFIGFILLFEPANPILSLGTFFQGRGFIHKSVCSYAQCLPEKVTFHGLCQGIGKLCSWMHPT